MEGCKARRTRSAIGGDLGRHRCQYDILQALISVYATADRYRYYVIAGQVAIEYCGSGGCYV